MSQTNKDFVPVFKYRGALNKDEALRQLAEEDDFEEEVDTISILKSKRKKSRGKNTTTSTAGKKVKKNGLKSKSGSDKENNVKLLRASDVIPISDSDSDDDFEKRVTSQPPAPIENFPVLMNTMMTLRANKELVNQLKKSSGSNENNNNLRQSAPQVVEGDGTTEELSTIVIHLKDRATGKIIKFRVYKTDPFQKLVENYVKFHQVPPDMEITLKFCAMPLSLTSTPEEENMLDRDVIDVYVTSKKISQPQSQSKADEEIPIDDVDDVTEVKPAASISRSSSFSLSSVKPTPSLTQEFDVIEEDNIKLKIRIPDKPDPWKFKLDKNAPFGKVFDACCQQFALPSSKAKFMFDGEVINRTSTPSDLDMEDGDLIDLMLK